MGYVYLICDPATDQFKIGVTRNTIQDRVKKLQTGNPSKLFIKDFYKTEWPFRLEKMLHNKFFPKQVMNEWYALDVDDIITFRQTCRSLEENIRALIDNPFFSKNLK